MNRRVAAYLLLPQLFLLEACISDTGGPQGPPPPPPPPPPTQANSSLFTLSLSEDFANSGASATAEQPKSAGAAGTTAIDGGDIRVVYFAENNSYAITSGNRAQTFRSADRDPAYLPEDPLRGYRRTDGGTTDTLVLTKPGDRGNPLRDVYVGAGFFERVVDAADKTTRTIDAFTYGVETPDAATPRTGGGIFSVDLAGYAGNAGGTTATLSGRGILQADFLSGDLQITGTAHELTAGTRFIPYRDVDRLGTNIVRLDVPFLAAATIASGANRFEGRFFYDDVVTASGEISGRFYGPAAEEVGAAVGARRDDGSFVIGTLTGGRDAEATGQNLNLVTLDYDMVFQVARTRSSATINLDGTGINAANLADDNIFHGPFFRYEAAGDSYFLSPYSLDFGELTFRPADRVAAESNARFTVYQYSTPENGRTYRLRLYNPGSGNDQLALSYAGFGGWEILSTNSNFDVLRAGFFNYGIVTPAIAVPRSGSASYAGVLTGLALGTTPGSTYYRLSGTSQLNYNFGTDRFTGSLSATGTDAIAGGTRDFGSFAMAGGAVAGNRSYFEGSVSGGVGGEVLGQFNGPAASEFSAIFNVTIDDSAIAGNQIILHGATAGKVD